LAQKIKTFDFADTHKLDELSALAKNTLNVKAIRPLAGALNDIRIIKGNSGFVGLSRGLSVADDLADLSRLKKLSAVTKIKFAGALTLATSGTEYHRSVTCFTASILNSSVYRLPLLINTSI
jgi:hypothetical protein